MTDVTDAVAAAHRSDWARIVAGLIRQTGDWMLAEDAFAAAFGAVAEGRGPGSSSSLAHDRGRNRAIDRILSAKSDATSAASTDWSRIVGLYDELLVLTPSPIISLNRAIAVGMRDGPDAGLALLDEVTDQLVGVHLVPAAKADLLRRADRIPEAAARYHEALQLAPTNDERAQLRQRLDRLLEV